MLAIRTNKDSVKKATVVVIVTIIGLLICAQALLFVLLALKIWVLFIFAVFDLAILVALIYFAAQRINEINEGMDNDVDNY